MSPFERVFLIQVLGLRCRHSSRQSTLADTHISCNKAFYSAAAAQTCKIILPLRYATTRVVAVLLATDKDAAWAVAPCAD